MLGLGRPRLKSRPSLLDLISRREHSEQPVRSESPEPFQPPSTPSTVSPPPELPPLPDSPAPASSTTSISLSTPPITSTMASKDTQEHGSIFSISGPVVVAENMIGCAMYELVRPQGAPPRDRPGMSLAGLILIDSPFARFSVKSDMTCCLVKLFESTRIRPPFRYMRKPV